MAYEIFLSYAKSDKEKAKIFVEVLEKQGYSIWWDRNIPHGSKYVDYIMEKLNQAKCIIVLWSNDSVKSEWVADEAEWGKRRRILVPVLIDDVAIPLGFGQYQTAQLFDWDGTLPSEEFELLSDSIAKILGSSYGRRKIKIQGRGEEEKLSTEDFNFGGTLSAGRIRGILDKDIVGTIQIKNESITVSKIKSNLNVVSIKGTIDAMDEKAVAVEGSKTHLFLITSVIPTTPGQIEWKWLTEYKNDYLSYVLMVRNLSDKTVIYDIRYFDISEK